MSDPIGDVVKTLASHLYADVRAAIVALARKAIGAYSRATTKQYKSPKELIAALHAGEIANGDRVVLQCKPALFGPFLRTHFLSPITGPHTRMRLGPPLLHPNPVLGMMAQATSHLTPVGLYPSLEPDVNQACLYPPDALACGFVGFFPGVNDLVPHLQAVISSRFLAHYGASVRLRAVVRAIDLDAMARAGFSPEDYEELRQIGRIWFIDATDDDSECEPLEASSAEKLWGGLYASGHLEIESGTLPMDGIIDAVADAMKTGGFDAHVSQNQAGQREVMLHSSGFRVHLGSQYPLYSLHMDAELGQSFGESRATFDRVLNQVLDNFRELCKTESVELRNELDVDFSYTESTTAYSVLKSLAADQIEDPLAVAIRDWHRRRGS